MIWTVITAFILYLAYNIFTFWINKWKAPHSISDTFYLLNEKKKGLGYLFPVVLTTMIGLLMPAWLEMSNGSPWQFLIFLTCAPLLFVAYAPAFRNKESLEGWIHCISAMVAMICYCVWLYLEMHMAWLLLIMAVIMIILGLINKTLVKSYIYWLEAVVFMTMSVSVFIYYGTTL